MLKAIKKFVLDRRKDPDHPERRQVVKKVDRGAVTCSFTRALSLALASPTCRRATRVQPKQRVLSSCSQMGSFRQFGGSSP